MASPIYFHTAPIASPFGLDASAFLVTAIVERREDAALTGDDLATIKAALAPHLDAPSTAAPSPSAEVRFVDVDLRDAFGLDLTRFRVTARIGRRDRQPLSDAEAQVIRAATARESIAAE